MRDLVGRVYIWATVGGQRGQGLLEYALVISFVALALVTAVAVFGDAVEGLYSRAALQLTR